MNTKTIAENRQARHEYFIIESLEAGIELFGTEVKSIRAGGVNLKIRGFRLTTEKRLSAECTFRRMKKEISSTATPIA